MLPWSCCCGQIKLTSSDRAASSNNQGGKIYVDKIAGEITPAPTAAQLGCLHVGGP
jgi:hypothetical protein